MLNANNKKMKWRTPHRAGVEAPPSQLADFHSELARAQFAAGLPHQSPAERAAPSYKLPALLEAAKCARSSQSFLWKKGALASSIVLAKQHDNNNNK